MAAGIGALTEGGGWEPWLKKTLENASWRLLVENRLADWFSSKKVRVSYSIHWILLLKRDFLQDFWDVCLSGFATKFILRKLSHAKWIHVYVLHLKKTMRLAFHKTRYKRGGQPYWPAKNDKTCIRTSVYCPGNSVSFLVFLDDWN